MALFGARSYVQCCAAQSLAESSKLLAPTTIASPILHRQAVEDEYDLCDEVTFIDYDNLPHKSGRRSSWLTPQYLDLRLRCSSLMRNEASGALKRHFKGRLSAVPVLGQFSDSGEAARTQEPVRVMQSLSVVDLITGCILAETQPAYFRVDSFVKLPVLEPRSTATFKEATLTG